ncbi:MAG: helix-turn-helix transcriptional regulator [Bacteroidia bacterium]|nr:helix-turn-helix transcriptional regulator [Bacteroidia bacterium]
MRLEKNLTIQELANRSRVSKGLLSKVENSRTIPSLPVFVNLIQSLNISLKEFFEDMVLLNGKDYLHIKARLLSAGDTGGSPGIYIRAYFFSDHSHKHDGGCAAYARAGLQGKTDDHRWLRIQVHDLGKLRISDQQRCDRAGRR